MVIWKNLRKEPPLWDCNICLKIGKDLNVFKFIRYSNEGWGLKDRLKEYDPTAIPPEALYIELDTIPIKNYGL